MTQYTHIDDDERLRNAAIRLPSYLSGQWCISDGPERCWGYLVSMVEHGDREAVMNQLCSLVNQLAWQPIARVEPGDSPGSDYQLWINTGDNTRIIAGWDWDMDCTFAAQEVEMENFHPLDDGKMYGTKDIDELGLDQLNVRELAHVLYNYWLDRMAAKA